MTPAAVEALDRHRGFNDLQRAIGGANTSTLSQRLEQLTRLGIVDKTVVSTMPPKVRYELTTAGVALQQVIDAIDAWGTRHMPARRGASCDAMGSGRTPPSPQRSRSDRPTSQGQSASGSMDATPRRG